jgi:hypothetical protein
MPSVFLFATLDPTGREADFVRDLLRSWRLAVTLVDVGALGRPAAAADVPRERIFELTETTLDAVQKKADRGEAHLGAKSPTTLITRVWACIHSGWHSQHHHDGQKAAALLEAVKKQLNSSDGSGSATTTA